MQAWGLHIFLLKCISSAGLPRDSSSDREEEEEDRGADSVWSGPVTSCPLLWSAYARLDQGEQRQLHGEALKWDEAQTWNCCHCDCFLHVVSQSVLVHGLAKWQRWVHLQLCYITWARMLLFLIFFSTTVQVLYKSSMIILLLTSNLQCRLKWAF